MRSTNKNLNKHLIVVLQATVTLVYRCKRPAVNLAPSNRWKKKKRNWIHVRRMISWRINYKNTINKQTLDWYSITHEGTINVHVSCDERVMQPKLEWQRTLLIIAKTLNPVTNYSSDTLKAKDNCNASWEKSWYPIHQKMLEMPTTPAKNNLCQHAYQPPQNNAFCSRCYTTFYNI